MGRPEAAGGGSGGAWAEEGKALASAESKTMARTGISFIGEATEAGCKYLASIRHRPACLRKHTRPRPHKLPRKVYNRPVHCLFFHLRNRRTSMNRRIRLSIAALSTAALLVPLLSSCKKEAPVAQAPKPTATPPKVSQADIEKFGPNEAGAVMVVMYHRILAKERESDLNRRPESLRSDLETLRSKGYFPVSALDLVENTMAVPAGKTPVVLTFDDALPSQFKTVTGADGKTHIDPDCAVGIMESFHKKYTDWPEKATFFVLPGGGRNAEPFGQADSVARKFKYLSDHGYEIANHTTTHGNMRRMDAAKIQQELASAVKSIKQVAPQADMRTFALPYGKLPRDQAARKYLQAGSSGGQSYSNKAVFLAAWRPVLSPVTREDKKFTQAGALAAFNPYALERVTPDARNAKTAGTLEYWIGWFDKNKSARYISDGVDEVVSAPASMQSAIDTERVAAQDKRLQLYGGADEEKGGKGGGGDLSVQ